MPTMNTINISSDDLSNKMWAQLISIIETEVTSGTRLAGIATVTNSVKLFSPPAIGVQFIGYDEIYHGTHRHQTHVKFRIVVGVASTPTMSGGAMTKTANLSDAMTALSPYLADGNGNGLANVLRDVKNNGLSNLAMSSKIDKLDLDWEIREGKTIDTEVWAYGIYSYSALSYVLI